MRMQRGLTSWCFRFGPAAVMWRWNMPLHEVIRTCRTRTFGPHGYLTAGPLIVEW